MGPRGVLDRKKVKLAEIFLDGTESTSTLSHSPRSLSRSSTSPFTVLTPPDGSDLGPILSLSTSEAERVRLDLGEPLSLSTPKEENAWMVSVEGDSGMLRINTEPELFENAQPDTSPAAQPGHGADSSTGNILPGISDSVVASSVEEVDTKKKRCKSRGVRKSIRLSCR